MFDNLRIVAQAIAAVWKSISTIMKPRRGPNLMHFNKAREANLIQRFNPLPAYFEHLRTLISTEVIAEYPQRFVVDAMEQITV